MQPCREIDDISVSVGLYYIPNSSILDEHVFIEKNEN